MEILLRCKYCDNTWRLHVYTNSKIENTCSRCGDTDITIKELSKSKIDGYLNCPPFEEENKEELREDPSFPFWVGTD
jgi:hypothetical protein